MNKEGDVLADGVSEVEGLQKLVRIASVKAGVLGGDVVEGDAVGTCQELRTVKNTC